MNIKSILITLLGIFAINSISMAQIIRQDELENYALEKYGDNWKEAATKIASEHPLDANHAFTFTEVLQAPGMDADKIYDELQVWFTSTFVDANSVIQSSERERGLIIARGFIDGTGSSVGAFTSNRINVTPTIKIQIKDEKIRVTYSVPFYIEINKGSGIVGMALAPTTRATYNTTAVKNVTLDQSFPYGKLRGMGKRARKRAHSRALIMCNAYANVILDKLDKVIKEGFDGTANDNW